MDPFIADTHPDDEAALPIGAQTDDRRHRELDRQRERDLQMDAEKQAKILNERYSSKRSQASGVVTLPKRLLLPTVEDPHIWAIACKLGKEEEIIKQIDRRVEDRVGSANPMPGISVFGRRVHCQSFIYVEARRVADVLACIEGIDFVFPKRHTDLVPIKEMPQLLRVNKERKIQPGDYVRIKRGKYKGDLAKVDDVEPNGLDATAKLVPRLDYGLNEDANAPVFDGGLKGQLSKRKRQGPNSAAKRPPQRLFSEVDAKKKHLKYLQSMSTLGKKHWTYLGDTYINGYLIKDFKVQHLDVKDVKPTLEDIARFNAGGQDETENLDLASLLSNAKNSIKGESFMPGEMVEVYEGEQKGVFGKAISVNADIVTVNVLDGELRGQNVDVPVKGLRKRFRAGDHVKVIGGTHIDEVGMVVHVKDDKVTFVSDLSMNEMTLFGKDLRETTDTGVAGGLGKYYIHALVQLE